MVIPPPGHNIADRAQFIAQPPFQQQQQLPLQPQQQQVKSETHIQMKKQSHAVSIIDPNTRKPIKDMKTSLPEKEQEKALITAKLNTNCEEFNPERQKNVINPKESEHSESE